MPRAVTATIAILIILFLFAPQPTTRLIDGIGNLISTRLSQVR